MSLFWPGYAIGFAIAVIISLATGIPVIAGMILTFVLVIAGGRVGSYLDTKKKPKKPTD